MHTAGTEGRLDPEEWQRGLWEPQKGTPEAAEPSEIKGERRGQVLTPALQC